MIDHAADRAFREFVAFWKPEIRWHAGDVFDFRWLRRGADDGDKSEEVAQDFEAGCEFLDWYRPTHINWGNHDHRLWRRFNETTNGAERHWCGQWIEHIADRTRGARLYPYCKRAGVGRLGNHAVIHGFPSGVNATRQHAQIYGPCIFGHTHRVERVAVDRLSYTVGHNIGCLAKLDLGYNAAHAGTLKQAHGWAYGYVLKSKELVIWQAEKTAGLWIVPSEMRSVG